MIPFSFPPHKTIWNYYPYFIKEENGLFERFESKVTQLGVVLKLEGGCLILLPVLFNIKPVPSSARLVW